MGTRGFIGLRDETRTVTAYNHFDSYPEGLGAIVSTFVRDADLDKVAEQFKAIVVVEEESTPTLEQRAVLEEKNFDGLDGSWYGILREFQGQLGEYLNAGFIPVWEASEPAGMLTATDSWLEYGYIVDLTKRELEAYEIRYQHAPRLVTSIPFDHLTGKTDEEIGAMMERLAEQIREARDAKKGA